MEMVQSLVVMVSKLSSEVQQLRIDDDILKTQLRDLQQAPSHVPSTQCEAASSAIANNATAKSYRDVACAVGGNPGATMVTAPARNFLKLVLISMASLKLNPPVPIWQLALILFPL
jgi:hypothetical protein